MSPTSSIIRRGRLPAPFKASAQPELNRLEQAAADFLAEVAKRDQKRDAELGEHLFTVAGAVVEALQHCMTSFKVRYACLYRRVLREDAATLRAINASYRSPGGTEQPSPAAVQGYFARMERLLDEEHNDEAQERGGGFLNPLLGLLQGLSDPREWPGTERENTAKNWTLCGEIAGHMYRSAKPKLEGLFQVMSQTLDKERVRLAERQYFDSIVLLFPGAGVPSWVEGKVIRRQLATTIARLKAELEAYMDSLEEAGRAPRDIVLAGADPAAGNSANEPMVRSEPVMSGHCETESLDQAQADPMNASVPTGGVEAEEYRALAANPLLVGSVRETLYSMGTKRLEGLDSPNTEDSQDEATGEPDLKADDLEAFLGLAAGEGYDFTTLDELMEELEVWSEKLRAPDLPEDQRTETTEYLKDLTTACLVEIILCLGEMKTCYARLWARARFSAMREAEKRPAPEDPAGYSFFVKTAAGDQEVVLPMELDAEQRQEVDETARVLNQRGGNIARADDVTVKVRRKENMFRGLLLVQGLEVIDIEVIQVTPFSRAQVKDPSYLASVVTAVNAATGPWRTRASVTVEEIDAEYEAKGAAIDRRYPQYWGPEGAGALICALEAQANYRNSLDDPEMVVEDDILEEMGRDPLGCLAIGLAAARELCATFDELPGSGKAAEEGLEAVKPVRQFFVSSFLADDSEPPEELWHVFDDIHSCIAGEFHLDKERRAAHCSSTGQRHGCEARLARIGEVAVEHKYGRATITGSCELLRLEPGPSVNRKAKFLALLNAAFERACHMRSCASMAFMG